MSRFYKKSFGSEYQYFYGELLNWLEIFKAASWQGAFQYLIRQGLAQKTEIVFKLPLKFLKRAIIPENVISKANLILNLLYVQFEVSQ